MAPPLPRSARRRPTTTRAAPDRRPPSGRLDPFVGSPHQCRSHAPAAALDGASHTPLPVLRWSLHSSSSIRNGGPFPANSTLEPVLLPRWKESWLCAPTAPPRESPPPASHTAGIRLDGGGSEVSSLTFASKDRATPAPYVRCAPSGTAAGRHCTATIDLPTGRCKRSDTSPSPPLSSRYGPLIPTAFS